MTPEENLARITEEVNEQMRRFGYILPETSQKLLEAQTGIQNFGFKVQVATSIMGNLADAVGDYTRAMYRGEKGAAVLNSSIDKMTDAAQMAAVGLSLLTPGGAIVKGLAAAFTFLTTQVLKQGAELTKTANIQADNMYEAFSQMAASGAVGADGIEGLFEDIQKLGLNVNKLDRFLAMAAQNADDLALLGGTVAKGRKNFADLGAGMAKYEEGLRRLGLEENEQAEAALRFAKMQNRLSLGQEQDYKKLADSAVKFIREQDTLTKLTGINAKQQSDALDEAMSNQRFAATIDELTRQGKKEEVKQLQDRLIIAKSMGQEKGFADIVSGNLQTEAARQYNMLTQGQGLRETEDIKAGRFRGDEAGLAAARQRTLEAGSDTLEKMGVLGKVGVFDDLFGAYSNAAKMGMMAKKNSEQQMADAKAATETQFVTAGKAVDAQAELRKAQNDTMLTLQAFVQTGIPNLAKNTMVSVATEFNKLVVDLRKKLGSGPIVGNIAGYNARQPRTPDGTLGTGTNPAIIPVAQPGDGVTGPSPDQRNPPPGGVRFPSPVPNQYTRQNPLPVIITGPPSVTNPPTPAAEPPRTPGGPRYDSRNPPPIPARADGTSGEIGKLFEPKDIIAQLHRGERVLNKNENTDLTKLFGMVTGDRSKNKMADPQGEMLKVIDSITSGMKTKAKPDANKGFDAAYADISSGMMNTGPAQQALIDSQGAILKQIDSFKTNAMPATANTGALLGAMPSLEIDKEAAEQIGQSFKETMGDEFKSAVTNISKFAEQMQRGGDQGLQQQMVGLLEEIRRSQASTAKASERLAQVASN
jgi:hypothetical protein